MRLPGRFFRSLIALTLLLQFAGAAAARFWHFPEEARALSHTEHIQAPGEGACIPHTDSSCQICRLGHTVAQASAVRTRLPIVNTPHSIDCPAALSVLPSEGSPLPVGSRAPPLA
jgi:hypothetical protein